MSNVREMKVRRIVAAGLVASLWLAGGSVARAQTTYEPPYVGAMIDTYPDCLHQGDPGDTCTSVATADPRTGALTSEATVTSPNGGLGHGSSSSAAEAWFDVTYTHLVPEQTDVVTGSVRLRISHAEVSHDCLVATACSLWGSAEVALMVFMDPWEACGYVCAEHAYVTVLSLNDPLKWPKQMDDTIIDVPFEIKGFEGKDPIPAGLAYVSAEIWTRADLGADPTKGLPALVGAVRAIFRGAIESVTFD